MKSTLLLVATISGCAYPEFAFQAPDVSLEDAELEVASDTDTAIDTSTPDSFDPKDSTASDASIDGDGKPDAAVLPVSCAEIHVTNPTAASARYLVDPDVDGPRTPFYVFCDMSSEGGGWALVAKLDGTKTTWAYDSAHWTDDATFNYMANDLSLAEGKFRSFNEMPLSQIRVEMRDGTTARGFFTNLVGTSLKDLFNGGAIATSAGRDKWSSLVPDPSLQTNCNAEGLNQVFDAGGARLHLRLGLAANEQTDCNSPDSFIGFGATLTTPNSCFGGVDPLVTVGNAARASCAAPKDKNTKLFGFLYVR